MNILVVGAGTIGRQLAEQLCVAGHDVSVVDPSPDKLATLADDFTGFTVSGVAIDSDVLRRAGVEGCDLVAAVTADDNVNAMVAQMSKEIFAVPRVVTRITDPRKREVFDRFGLNTVCQTSLTVSALESVVNESTEQQVTFDQGSTLDIGVGTAQEFVGRMVSEVRPPKGNTLVGLLRPDGKMHMMGDDDCMVTEQDRFVFARLID